MAGDKQGYDRAGKGERQRKHYYKRGDKRFKFRRHHHINDYDGKYQRKEQALERLCHLLRFTPEIYEVARREVYVFDHLIYILCDTAQITSRRVTGDQYITGLVFPVDL